MILGLRIRSLLALLYTGLKTIVDANLVAMCLGIMQKIRMTPPMLLEP